MAGNETTSTFTVVTAGTDILHFHIIEQIGAGGMGEVYLADDTKLHRRVALKFLPAAQAGDREYLERFVREAQAAARLSHPNIIVIFEVGDFRGRPFFAMELLDGISLHMVASQRSMSMEDLTAVARQVVEGLAHAHGLGVIHRDIKGGNIYLTKDGRVKILDFGLASLSGGKRVTNAGSTLGTIAYMSPEQIKGLEADQRSDLFSFGVVLYELITGKLPFRRSSDAATMHAILTEVPEPLSRNRPGISEDWQRMVDKALQKDPSMRYQTAADWLADLKRLGQTSHPSLRIADHRKVLAVLPFDNVGAMDQEYFADGITDEITSRLAKLRDLTVISNSSAQQYKKTDKRLKQVAQELGASYLLQGTIRWDKSATIPRIRINAKLVLAEDESYLWAETYDRMLEQIFAVQSELAERVADALGVALIGREHKSHPTGGTDNLEAYDTFLKAADKHPGSLDLKDIGDAINLYQQATVLDPGYAAAYARLAGAEIAMYQFGGSNSVNLEQARSHIDRAFELTPGLLEAHLSLGYWYYVGKLDFVRAVEQFQTVFAVEPNNVGALFGLALVHRRQGLFEQSIEETKRLLLLDPRNAVLPHQLAISYMSTRQLDEALKYIDRAIWLKPNWGDAYQIKAWIVALISGNLQTGVAVYRQALEHVSLASLLTCWHDFDMLLGLFDNDPTRALAALSPNGMSMKLYLLMKARLYGLMGKQELKEATLEALLVMLEQAQRERPDNAMTASYLAFTYALLEKPESAIASAQRSVALCPLTRDALQGANQLELAAAVYVMVKAYDQAIDALEQLLRIHSMVDRRMLLIASACRPLWDHPRFQELIRAQSTA